MLATDFSTVPPHLSRRFFPFDAGHDVQPQTSLLAKVTQSLLVANPSTFPRKIEKKTSLVHLPNSSAMSKMDH